MSALTFLSLVAFAFGYTCAWLLAPLGSFEFMEDDSRG